MLTASAKPPAKLALLAVLDVSRPGPVPLTEFTLPPLSLGCGGGAGFLPAGLLVGGAGGVGFALTPTPGPEAVRMLPLACTPLLRGGTGTGRAATAGAGGSSDGGGGC